MADLLAQYEKNVAQIGGNFSVLHHGHEIRISGQARRWVESELLVARSGFLGVATVKKREEDYRRMGNLLLQRAAKAAEEKNEQREAWLDFWGCRHLEIADQYFETYDAQNDFER